MVLTQTETFNQEFSSAVNHLSKSTNNEFAILLTIQLIQLIGNLAPENNM